MKKIAETDKRIVAMVKYGGFYRWDWKFPFRHYVQERTYIATESEIYLLEVLEKNGIKSLTK